MYLYKKTEPTLWTVGFHTPKGKWMPESDHNSTEEASKRVRYLDGGPYVYIRSEPQLWTVGRYIDLFDRFEPEEDFNSPEEAAERVHYLNGGK